MGSVEWVAVRWVALAVGLAAGCGGARVGASTGMATDPRDQADQVDPAPAELTGRGLRECADAPGQVPVDEVQHYLYVAESAFILTASDGSVRRIEAGRRPRETLERAARELRRVLPEVQGVHVIVDPYVGAAEADAVLEVLRAEELARSIRCRPSEHSPFGSVSEAVSAAQRR